MGAPYILLAGAGRYIGVGGAFHPEIFREADQILREVAIKVQGGQTPLAGMESPQPVSYVILNTIMPEFVQERITKETSNLRKILIKFISICLLDVPLITATVDSWI